MHLILSNQSENVWLRIWNYANFEVFPLWDELSELVFNLLTMTAKKFKDQLILEEGSGTGRISLRLAAEGKGRAILLDISSNAIKYSKNLAQKLGVGGDFIVGSIFSLPFRNCSLDMAWNSGVLEHYSFNNQQKSISEVLRVLRRNGRLAVIVPNRRAFIYNFSRMIDKKTGRWKLGYEEPLCAEDLHNFSPRPVFTHSVGVLYQFRFFSLPYFGRILNLILSAVHRLIPYFKTLDKKCPGYLLIGLWIKKHAY